MVNFNAGRAQREQGPAGQRSSGAVSDGGAAGCRAAMSDRGAAGCRATAVSDGGAATEEQRRRGRWVSGWCERRRRSDEGPLGVRHTEGQSKRRRISWWTSGRRTSRRTSGQGTAEAEATHGSLGTRSWCGVLGAEPACKVVCKFNSGTGQSRRAYDQEEAGSGAGISAGRCACSWATGPHMRWSASLTVRGFVWLGEDVSAGASLATGSKANSSTLAHGWLKRRKDRRRVAPVIGMPVVVHAAGR